MKNPKAKQCFEHTWRHHSGSVSLCGTGPKTLTAKETQPKAFNFCGAHWKDGFITPLRFGVALLLLHESPSFALVKEWSKFFMRESGWWFGTCFMTFHSLGNVIIPTDELHHFSGGWLNHQPGIRLGYLVTTLW